MRQIDADALKDELLKGRDCGLLGDIARLIIKYIDAAPTLTGNRRESYWIAKNSHTYICDNCSWEEAIYGEAPSVNYYFCPHCGSAMVQKNEDDYY